MQVEDRRGLLAAFAVVAVLAVLAVSAGVAGVGAAEGVDNANTAESDEQAFVQDIDADSVVLVADIDADGNAEWQVIYRQRLDDDADREAFEDLEDAIEEDPDEYLDPFVDRMERTVANAADATDREMSAEDFSVSTERRPQADTELGEVVFSFRWHGFAAVEDGGDRIHAGDAIDRLFLDEDRNLQLRWPDAYGLTDVTPDPAVVEEQRVIWRGPFEFDEGQPRITVATDDGEPVDRDVGDRTAPNGDDATVSDDSTLPLLAALVVGVVIVAGAAFLWRRQEDEAVPGETTESEATGAGGEPSEDTEDGPPPELLSNEERVLRLLEQNGGRMKQQEVAEQLEWTDAKTSQVVGDLRDDDEVESFRLGRENVLTLPDVDIDGSTDDGDGTGGDDRA